MCKDQASVGETTRQRRPTGDTCVGWFVRKAQASGTSSTIVKMDTEYGDARYISAHGARPTDDGAVVFDCRPAVLPVSVDVSGIDMQTVRRAEPPAEMVVAPTECEQVYTRPMWLNDIYPELEVTPLLDSGTDFQDELSSPDGSPMFISPIAGLSQSQGNDDITLVHILAEFGTLPAFVSPIMD